VTEPDPRLEVPCNKFDGYIGGNLTKEPLADIWRGAAFRQVRGLASQPITAGPTCAACDFQSVCAGGCRAEAYRAFGSLTAPDPACAILDRSAIHASLDRR
jgi:radical SAM protein with 4Fe4S-binding SPASM domain